MKFGTWTSPTVGIPWLDDLDFLKIHERIRQRTLVSMDRCYNLYAMARHRRLTPGAFAECGVYKGGTALLLATLAREQGKRLYLFDTFSGIPDGKPGLDTRYVRGGGFSDTSKEEVETFVRGAGGEVTICAGLIPETFSGDVGSERFSVVHLDLDIYKSTLDALTFFWDRLRPGGVIILDDYGFEECQGARLAADKFGHWAGIPPVVLPTGQAFFIAM